MGQFADSMGKLKNELAMGGVQGGWTQPCLLPMAMGHHSLVSSQSLHLHAPASEVTGRLKRAKTWCLMAFHNLLTYPWQSLLQWNKEKIKAARVQPLLCNSFLYVRLLVSPSGGGGGCHCALPLQCHLQCGQSEKTAEIPICSWDRKSCRCGWGRSLKIVVWTVEFGNCYEGEWNYLSSTHSVPETVIHSLHIISSKHHSQPLKWVLLSPFYR